MRTPIIFFDDFCVLCSRSVRFIHKNDRKNQIFFSSLDSNIYSQISTLLPSHIPIPDSVILYEKGKVYTRSGAALRIAMKLKFPFPLLAIGYIFPPFIRNAIYDWIAIKRYKWFGKLDTCFLPDESLRDKYLN